MDQSEQENMVHQTYEWLQQDQVEEQIHLNQWHELLQDLKAKNLNLDEDDHLDTEW